MDKTLKCSDCKKNLPVSDFHVHKQSSRGYKYSCKKCRRIYNQREDQRQRAIKYAKDYRENTLEKDQRLKYHIAKKEYYKTPEGKRSKRNSDIQGRYGITLKMAEEILKLQNGVCAICGKNDLNLMDKGHTVIDHNHNTGEVRGILCRSCNGGIGFLNTPSMLDKAKKYLKDKGYY